MQMKLLIRTAINKCKTRKIMIAALTFLMLAIAMIAYAAAGAPPVSGIYDADRGTTTDGTFSGQVGKDSLNHQLICVIKSVNPVYAIVDKEQWSFTITVALNRNVTDSYLTAILRYKDPSGTLKEIKKELHNNGDSWTFSGTAMKLDQKVMNQNLAQVVLGNLEVHAGEKQWLATAYDVTFRASPL
jgi:hypothetical protein